MRQDYLLSLHDFTNFLKSSSYTFYPIIFIRFHSRASLFSSTYNLLYHLSKHSGSSLWVYGLLIGEKLAKKSKSSFCSTRELHNGTVPGQFCFRRVGLWQRRWWDWLESKEKFIEHPNDLAETGPHIWIFDPTWLNYISQLRWNVFWKSRPLLLHILTF